MINALANGSIDNLSNLAEARDTQTMIRLLSENGPEADVLDAGTTMRFLTAYYAVTGAVKKMTGTPRMCERPIGILVDALRTLGADITYLNKDGYPPMQLNGFTFKGNREISIRGDVSSQFISAILMVAPLLPAGLKLQITGALGSKPYIEMTLAQMKHFGIQAIADWSKGSIEIPAQKYTLQPFAVESDWSGASYWYSMVALSPFEDSSLELLGLKEDSLQGDSAIKAIMEPLGVKSTYTGRGYLLTKIPAQAYLAWDFTDCPDLAQTICVIAVVKDIPLTLASIGEMLLETEDVEIIPVDIPGWKVVNHGNLTVALDVTITEALRAEGIAREVVNRIQNIRKESQLEVIDRIRVTLTANSLWSDAINQNSQYIRGQVLADSLTLVENFQEGERVEWEENQTMFIQISKS